jgi:hypothetical protein
MNTHEVLELWLKGLSEGEWEPFIDHLHPDYTETYPQTGEVFKGRENFKALVEAWPNLPAADEVEIMGPQEPKVTVVRSPMPLGQPVIHVTEGDGRFSAQTHVRYPDGSEFILISLGRMEDGLIRENTLYWAAPEEPAEWRKPFVATD